MFFNLQLFYERTLMKLFQHFPDKYKFYIDQILKNQYFGQCKAIQEAYSKFVYSYINYEENNEKNCNDKEKIQKRMTRHLIKYLKNYKFMTYLNDLDKSQITDQNNDINGSNLMKCNAIICCESNITDFEARCLIIDQIDSQIFEKIINELRSQNESALIDCCPNSENIDEQKEVNSFCSNFTNEIQKNEFIKRAIKPMICYLIRRHFYPSKYFQNCSFFTYNQPKKQNEINIVQKVYDIFNQEEKYNNIDIIQSFFLKFSGDGNDTYDQRSDHVERKDFKMNDFILLKELYANERGCAYHLAIHVYSLHIFAVKIVSDINQYEHELEFCKKCSHRCMVKFFGFVYNKNKVIGFVYEFMSNGTLDSCKISDDLFSLMTVNRIFQVIEYLHSHSLIHRDLKPLNILLDHDNIPYVTDYETIRQPSEDEAMTGDMASFYYMSPEQNSSSNVSYPTDIYSFGLIIYFLSEKENIGFISMNEKIRPISFGSEMFKNLYKQCLNNDPSKRPTYKDIGCAISDDFFSTKYVGNYFFNKIENAQIKLDFDLMIHFIHEIKFLPNPISHIITMGYLQQIDLLLVEKYSNSYHGSYYFYLADNYLSGDKVDANYKKALDYYEKSADLGFSEAYFRIGEMYYDGRGVQQDYMRAIQYFEKAAQQDNTKAVSKLGIMYLEGIGVKKDEKKAQEYFDLEAFIDDEDDIFNKFDQSITNNDYVNAYRYAKILHRNYAEFFSFFLGFCHQYGIGVKKNFLQAINYYKCGASINDGDCICSLGTMYFRGEGTPVDYYKAKQYYKKAAELNYSEAFINLGFIYMKGIGFKQNFSKAKEYFEKGAKMNNSEAIFYLGNLYFNGFGVEKNYSIAQKYFERSAKLNYPRAYLALGDIYKNGLGVKRNYEQMIRYYDLASQAGNLKAILFLGDCYSTGDIVNIDINKSIQLYNKCISIYDDDLQRYDSFESGSLENKFTGYIHIAKNDLGLIYITIFQEMAKGIDLIKESAFSEYPFAQNNFGLINQFYLNNIDNAEHMYKRSSEHEFALAEYNLGNLYELKGDKEKSIKYYINASEHQDSPLIFQKYNHYDKRLEISKLFIICLTNLKLADYYFNESEYEESKKYFSKSISLINSNKEYIQYKFKIKFPKNNAKILFSFIKSFILGFPLFDIFNQPNLESILNEFKDEISHPDQFYCDIQNDSCDNSKNNYFNEKESLNENSISYHFQKVKTNNLYEQKKDFANDKNEKEMSFEDPDELFDFIIMNDELKFVFINKIQDIIELMKKILYAPNYCILFGRISLEKPLIKQMSNIKDINDVFYQGFGYEIYQKI